ncbi:MAG: RNA-binding S4 domain-containing protein [Tissierellia bacterium]|jgi:ribosome-associated protein|nr:RNA-binding S4 domain-containing protein [Tissierellia bacterium]
MEKININTEYIKLDQLLKYTNAVEGGGMAKNVILDGLVKVNGEVVLQRGKKLREGDVIEFNNKKYLIKRYGTTPNKV